ncbi:MAG: helix-turn-helix domain-containing protein [Deltaproteobacteria bacterium]|nr:helix-turn-helix domain-containing protein [Deltaproteobacteria bacterium]
MRDFREQNFYELLDCRVHATQQEIENAYKRARRFFSPDSVATYALFQADELKLLRQRIEEAYQALSDPRRRRQYDQEMGMTPGPLPSSPPSQPPVEPAGSQPAPDLAEAAVQDVGPEAEEEAAIEAPPVVEPVSQPAGDEPAEPGAPVEGDIETSSPDPHPEAASEAAASAPAPAEEAEQPEAVAPELDAPEAPEEPAGPSPAPEPPERAPMPEITAETEFSGALLAEIREARGISIERIADVTKINIYYLRLIEAEDYSDLPAEVYVRGYLKQVAQFLGLDPARVAASYLERKRAAGKP